MSSRWENVTVHEIRQRLLLSRNPRLPFTEWDAAALAARLVFAYDDIQALLEHIDSTGGDSHE